jgi:hypothetical protein
VGGKDVSVGGGESVGAGVVAVAVAGGRVREAVGVAVRGGTRDGCEVAVGEANNGTGERVALAARVAEGEAVGRAVGVAVGGVEAVGLRPGASVTLGTGVASATMTVARRSRGGVPVDRAAMTSSIMPTSTTPARVPSGSAL